MKRYNVVLFDLDDTLINTALDERNAIESVFADNGLPFGEDVVEVFRKKADWQTYMLGDFNAKAEFTSKFVQLLDNLAIKNDRQKLIDEYFDKIRQSKTLTTDAKKVLRSLKKRGYRIYLTANGYSAFQRKRIELAGLTEYFDGIFISEEADVRKPCKAFYDYVMSRIPESNISKVLVVGDAQSTDILGAKNARMDSCWYNPNHLTPKYQSTYEIDSIDQLLLLLDKKQ